MAGKQRDAELRGSMLTQAKLIGDRSPDGWLPASKLAVAARDEDRDGVRDDEHANTLIDDLVGLGLLDDKRPTERGIAPADLRHRLVRLSDKGREWCHGRLDPIPGVWHWREEK